MSNPDTWYIVKQPNGQCEIVPVAQLPASDSSDAIGDLGETDTSSAPTAMGEKWGPFPSLNEAIARRVGLIRAGKCQPV